MAHVRARRLLQWTLPIALVAAPVGGQVPSDLTLTPQSLGLSSPLFARAADDGSGRLFFGERNGALLVWNPGGSLEPFLDLTSSVNTSGEGGLLGLAFHPQFASNGYFYVSYTTTGPSGSTSLTSIIERYRVSSLDPNRAAPGTALEIFRLDQPAWNHNGGDLHFGPDGFLYLALGDGGGAGATQLPQDLSSFFGKVLRIDPCDRSSCSNPYRVPSSNPYVGQASALPEIWASGLRNPYRFSFDRATGDLWIADVGAGSWEEIDFASAQSQGGENYGWACREGPASGPRSCSGTFVDPVLSYPHTQGNCSVTGGYRYRGCVQGLWGAYVYGDYCTSKIYIGWEQPNGSWTSSEWTDLPGNLVGFGEDENGDLYVLERNQVYRFDSASDCYPPGIFADGFESGDTSSWS